MTNGRDRARIADVPSATVHGDVVEIDDRSVLVPGPQDREDR